MSMNIQDDSISLLSDEPGDVMLQEPVQNLDWEFAGWGSVRRMELYPTETHLTSKHKLSQFPATAIAGNDITSSCLYTAGLVAAVAGKFSPISLAIVVIVLYLYKNVYAEVGSALPLNGGAYNALLNTTTKFVASVAAMLTMLSYIATAVVSATEAMHYAKELWDPIAKVHHWGEFPITWTTIGVLGFFALLNLIGISESAYVALGIFSIHIVTLLVLIGFSLGKVVYSVDILKANWNLPPIKSPAEDIFFGFCTGLLGVSGFESSSNYIEEQKKGVFPKTLRNMIICVAFFNPLISLLSISYIPMHLINSNAKQLLAYMASVCGGRWLNIWVSLDAVLVLSGAVLTSYVGIVGLVKRLALDRCLPQFLLQTNSFRRTNHWIIIGFFLLTSSMFLLVGGHNGEHVDRLGGVYTVAFLGVMTLFAVGNILLKYKRGKLPRTVKSWWTSVILAMASTTVALVGNIIMNISALMWFSIYFAITFVIVVTMLQRAFLMKVALFFLSNHVKCFGQRIRDWMTHKAKEIRNQSIVFFTKNDDLSVLNKAVLYVRENEITKVLSIVHIYETEDLIPVNLEKHVAILDKMYPKIAIHLILVNGKFDPTFVQELSTNLGVPTNFMFITCPSNHFPHNIGDFGGVRLITH
eukprot:TRINITY_DN11190_c0_g1_i1.p1 TRINITY_DN11190_c0_g1~~TRINITY_DN11190_c0_g1_i1.p1  ORF type:complete len:640 (+),score=73.60 TRINITY_DN11190_c0_g1_i1:62-1981(+)